MNCSAASTAPINFSAGRWLAEAEAVAEPRLRAGRPAIFVGGTGLYFRALTEGFSDIPAVPEDVRAQVRAEAEPLQSAQSARRARRRAIRRPPRGFARATGSAFFARSRFSRRRGRPLASFQGARGAPLLDAGAMGGRVSGAGARGSQRGHRRGVSRRCCAAGALGEVAAPGRAPARSRAAGHARAWRAAPDRASRGRPVARRGGGAGRARHPPLRQAAIHLGAPPDAGFRLGRPGRGR